MATFRQVVYMIMDYLKLSSDDSYFTPDHIAFMLGNYRAYILKSKYENIAAQPSEQNYQTLRLPLEEVNAIDGFPCKGNYMRTVDPLPEKAQVGICSLYGADFLSKTYCWTSPQRFRYVGTNRWVKNIVYAAKGDDGRIYLKSCNPQLYYLESVGVRGIFADPLKAAEYTDGSTCDPMDNEFPLESNLLPLVMQYVVKEFNAAEYKPEDRENNANDDLGELAQFIRSYIKTPFRSQIGV